MVETVVRIVIFVALASFSVWYCNKWFKQKQRVVVARTRKKWKRLCKNKSFDGRSIASQRLDSRRLFKLGRAISIPISLLLAAYISNFALKLPSSEPEQWGQMGDFFGGMLNPILAFASFIALLYTIRIQSEELKLTRAELGLTRDELAASAKANKRMSESAEVQLQIHKQQNAENAFYRCIDRLIVDVKSLHEAEFRVSLNRTRCCGGSQHQPVERTYKTNYQGFCVVMFNRVGQTFKTNDGDKVYAGGVPLSADYEIFRVKEDATSSYYVEATATNFGAFEQLIYSLNHAFYWLKEILRHRSEFYVKEYFRHHIIKLVDDDMLVLLALILGRNMVIPLDTINEFDLFRSLNVDKDGYLQCRKVNVTELKILQKALHKFYPASYQNDLNE